MTTTTERQCTDYLKDVRAQLNAWQADIDDIRVRIDLAEKESRQSLDAAVRAAERAWSVAEQHLADAERDASATFDAVRTGLDEMLREVATATRAAWAELNRR